MKKENVAESSHSELVVYDGCEPCPYLPGRVARMPLRMPTYPVAPAVFDQQLQVGDRRTGVYLYRTSCPECQECQAIRLPVDEFVLNSTMRRVKRRGDKQLRIEQTEPVVDLEHVQLFNLHRSQRGLEHDGQSVSISGYSTFLADSCCDTFELSYWLGEELIAVAISDVGATALSAVYCYFNPAHGRFSPGVYSILKQIEYCQMHNMQHLYLGLYIAGSPHMAYKARYTPHERLINNTWQRFEK